MATTSIGNTAGGSVADPVQEIKSNLGDGLRAGRGNNVQTLKDGANGAKLPLGGNAPTGDVASVLLSEVATTDLTKLTKILDPASDATNNQVLDSLLRLAMQEVANGNGERAVGYLADYATRDPRRAEALPLQPELEPVRDKIDSMVSRMAQVAKMSAQDGLSRAEQTVSEAAGKLSNWDTNAEVLMKLAHRLFDAGGYANYSRTAELAKVVSDAGTRSKPNDQALAAAAATAISGGAASQAMNQMLPGINVPYWASPDFQVNRTDSGRRISPLKTASSAGTGTVGQNLRALKEVSAAALRQLWVRAPLLVLMLAWFAIGLAGGVSFALGSRVWPDGLFVTVGNLAFSLWGLAFLALVGFGFYARVKYSPRR